MNLREAHDPMDRRPCAKNNGGRGGSAYAISIFGEPKLRDRLFFPPNLNKREMEVSKVKKNGKDDT
jgi:hypothetical protein